jgi:hypothetical protein
MAILTSAFAYLGSYYGEANPSLQGFSEVIYTSVDVNVVLRSEPLYQGQRSLPGNHGQANI